MNFIMTFPFCQKRINIEKVVAKLHDKKRICYRQKKFKTCIKPWISIANCTFNQDAWLTTYIDVNRAKKKCKE